MKRNGLKNEYTGVVRSVLHAMDFNIYYEIFYKYSWENGAV
jgi:hypothetical protein